MRLPWTRAAELVEAVQSEPTDLISIGDPVLAGYFGIGNNFAGVPVGEDSVLGISAVYRAVSLISSTIASLPLKTYRTIDGEQRQQVGSFLDNPGGPGKDALTPFEWKQTVLIHMLLHGRAPLIHIYNQAGGLVGLQPIHPYLVSVDSPSYTEDGRLLPKTFSVTLQDGSTKKFTSGVNMTEILGMSVDGWYGLSIIDVARNSLGTTIAADRAAAKMFSDGFLVRGLVSTEEDVDEDEAKIIKAGLDKKTAGWENAGEVAFVNRKLKFDPWTMSMEDAQFLQSRQFQIEEVARWFGIPPFELMQTEKQTSWGTGIEAQQRGLARGNLLGWTMRMEQKLSRLLSEPRFCEFEFAGLERPTPEQEIRLLVEQVRNGLITVNEARKIRNLPPVAGGDELRTSTASLSPPVKQEEDEDALV